MTPRPPHTRPGLAGYLRIGVLVCTMPVAANCTGYADEGRVVARHPVPETDPALWTLGRDKATVGAAFAAKLTELNAFVPKFTIGGDSEVFINIGGVARLEPAGTAVLDIRTNDVRVFDDSGVRRARLGGAFAGEEGFGLPIALASTRNGFVVAERTGQVKEYRRKGAGYQYQYEATHTLHEGDIDVQDLCVSLDDTYVRAWSEAGLIHRLQPRLPAPSTFSPSYVHPRPSVSRMVAPGFIECSPTGLAMVAADKIGGSIEGWSSTGERLWITRLEDFEPGFVEEVSRGDRNGFRASRERDWDQISSLILWDDEFVIVQTQRFSAETNTAKSISTYLLQQSNGHGTRATDALPLLSAAIKDKAYAVVHQPMEQLVVLAVSSLGVK